MESSGKENRAVAVPGTKGILLRRGRKEAKPSKPRKKPRRAW
jgi:hypothetical protein